jgi:hypothetical protein
VREQQRVLAFTLGQFAPTIGNPLTEQRERFRVGRIIASRIGPEARQVGSWELVSALSLPSAEAAFAEGIARLDGNSGPLAEDLREGRATLGWRTEDTIPRQLSKSWTRRYFRLPRRCRLPLWCKTGCACAVNDGLTSRPLNELLLDLCCASIKLSQRHHRSARLRLRVCNRRLELRPAFGAKRIILPASKTGAALDFPMAKEIDKPIGGHALIPKIGERSLSNRRLQSAGRNAGHSSDRLIRPEPDAGSSPALGLYPEHAN